MVMHDRRALAGAAGAFLLPTARACVSVNRSMIFANPRGIREWGRVAVGLLRCTRRPLQHPEAGLLPGTWETRAHPPLTGGRVG